MLFTLHGEVFFNEDTVCERQNTTGVENARLTHPKGATAHTCKLRLSGSDNRRPHFTKRAIYRQVHVNSRHTHTSVVGAFGIIFYVRHPNLNLGN